MLRARAQVLQWGDAAHKALGGDNLIKEKVMHDDETDVVRAYRRAPSHPLRLLPCAHAPLPSCLARCERCHAAKRGKRASAHALRSQLSQGWRADAWLYRLRTGP